MDGIHATFTSLIVIAIIFLIVFVVCHFLKPRAVAWIRSNGEEKISLSKNKLYHANGYMIQSNSDILLGSTGSFKRFDSVDRDYKQVGQQSSLTSPTWNIPAADNIPPQPLRPAPAPGGKFNKPKTEENSRTIKQQSLDRTTSTTAIPRPTTRRQLSTPISSTSTPVNLSSNIFNITKLPRLCTNPFLNGTLETTLATTTSTINSTSSESDLFSSPDSIRHSTSSSNASPNNLNTSNPFISNKTEQNPNISNYFSFTNQKYDKEKFSINEETENEIEAHQRSSPSIINEEDDVFIQKSTSSLISQKQTSPSSTSLSNDNTNFFNILTNLNDDIAQATALKTQQQSRARSLSETEFFTSQHRKIIDYEIPNTSNPFIKTKLHKTLSENYLEQYNGMRTLKNGYKTSLSRESSIRSLGSNCSIESNIGTDESQVQRALSCESMTSQSSILLSDLENPVPLVTGYLCIGLQYDKNSLTDAGQELIVTVLEAKELIGPADCDAMNTFVRIYIVPDETGAMQTKLFKNSSCPSYNESFSFWITRKSIRRSLWFHLYHTNSKAHTLIGEAEMKLNDINRPITTWLALSDSKHNKTFNNGEIMFSLSYLPTAERLTIVVVKARNLKLNFDQNNTKNIFVKTYLLKNNKKVSKKKTLMKRNEKSPIYNESMIFSIPPYMLNSIQIRLTVVSVSTEYLVHNDKYLNGQSIGHVIVGSGTSGKGLRHWHQMLTSLRKPVAMWHPLRITTTKKAL